MILGYSNTILLGELYWGTAEMLIPSSSSFEEPHWMTESIFISMPANYCKSVSQSKEAGSSKNNMCDSHNC